MMFLTIGQEVIGCDVLNDWPRGYWVWCFNNWPRLLGVMF